jgi:hypothetical protein
MRTKTVITKFFTQARTPICAINSDETTSVRTQKPNAPQTSVLAHIHAMNRTSGIASSDAMTAIKDKEILVLRAETFSIPTIRGQTMNKAIADAAT